MDGRSGNAAKVSCLDRPLSVDFRGVLQAKLSGTPRVLKLPSNLPSDCLHLFQRIKFRRDNLNNWFRTYFVRQVKAMVSKWAFATQS